MKVVNRLAVVVIPGKPFLDWLHRVDPTSSEITLRELEQDASVYLLEDAESDAEARGSLRKAFRSIFKQELDGWYRDATVWPEQNFSTFLKWFRVTLHSMVVDTCAGPLKIERL